MKPNELREKVTKEVPGCVLSAGIKFAEEMGKSEKKLQEMKRKLIELEDHSHEAHQNKMQYMW